MDDRTLSHASLKRKHRSVRDSQPTNLTLRIHRALSWLNRAEQAKDVDGQFIFLWVAFNAAYAQELEDSARMTDKRVFAAFIEKLCELDKVKNIERMVWNKFPGSIRVLLDNPFVCNAFWDYQRGRIDAEEWKRQFEAAKRAANSALASRNTAQLLSIAFSRLYTLRNQLIHGGATWDGQVNRDQLRDATRLLSRLVPEMISLMMDNPNELWGEAVYPVLGDNSRV